MICHETKPNKCIQAGAHSHAHTHTHIYIYIYWERERERETDRQTETEKRGFFFPGESEFELWTFGLNQIRIYQQTFLLSWRKSNFESVKPNVLLHVSSTRACFLYY